MMFLCSSLIYNIKSNNNRYLWPTREIVEYRHYHPHSSLVEISYFGPNILIIRGREYP